MTWCDFEGALHLLLVFPSPGNVQVWDAPATIKQTRNTLAQLAYDAYDGNLVLCWSNVKIGCNGELVESTGICPMLIVLYLRYLAFYPSVHKLSMTKEFMLAIKGLPDSSTHVFVRLALGFECTHPALAATTRSGAFLWTATQTLKLGKLDLSCW